MPCLHASPTPGCCLRQRTVITGPGSPAPHLSSPPPTALCFTRLCPHLRWFKVQTDSPGSSPAFLSPLTSPPLPLLPLEPEPEAPTDPGGSLVHLIVQTRSEERIRLHQPSLSEWPGAPIPETSQHRSLGVEGFLLMLGDYQE
jgi:hypothetical protein